MPGPHAARGTGRSPFPGRGFTLVELMLVLSLLVLLTGLVAVSLSAMSGGTDLQTGSDRFTTLLRVLRAEAANHGRCFRLNFDEETLALRVEWEYDPLEAPGQYAVYQGGMWDSYIGEAYFRVRSCRLTGSSVYLTPSGGLTATGDEPTCMPVMFYPDGSSDSAVFELAGPREDDTRTAVVELNGVTGSAVVRILSAEEYEEYQDEGR